MDIELTERKTFNKNLNIKATSILAGGNQAEVAEESQVMVFSNPENSYREKNHKLGANKLVIDIYLPGEKFTF